MHNDREVKENSDVWTTQRTDGYCELFISEAFPEDMGEYICKAVNVAGTATTRAHVHVEGEPFRKTLLMFYELRDPFKGATRHMSHI